MKTKYLLILLPLGLAATALGRTSTAEAGSDSHGGDIQCEAQIRTIKGNLLEWITGGGPEAGKLNLSTSLNPSVARPRPYTRAEYGAAMSELLRKPLDINCVKPGDPGYPVAVGGASKICMNTVDAAGVHMTCDRELLGRLSTERQFQQIHHEYATDVPGLEPDQGSVSTYGISVYISDYLETVPLKRLAVMAPPRSLNHSPIQAMQCEGYVVDKLSGQRVWLDDSKIYLQEGFPFYLNEPSNPPSLMLETGNIQLVWMPNFVPSQNVHAQQAESDFAARAKSSCRFWEGDLWNNGAAQEQGGQVIYTESKENQFIQTVVHCSSHLGHGDAPRMYARHGRFEGQPFHQLDN